MDFQFGNKGLPLGSPASTNLSKNKEASPANFSSVYENNFKDNKDQNLNFSGFTSPSSQLSIEENESFRVYVRIRPLTQKEQTSQNNKRRPTVIKAEDTKVNSLLYSNKNV